MRPHALFLSYHLPMPEEPGAFRPWMEARLLARAGFRVTVVTSGVQYMTGEDIRPGRGWCTEETVEGVRVLRTWAPRDHRRSVPRRILNYLSYTLLAGFASLFRVGKVDRVFAGTDPIFMMPMVFLVALLKRAALVLDERDLYPETAIALGVVREGWLTRRLFAMQQFFRRRALSILAATPGIRRRLIEYGHGEGKVRLLYNADAFLDEDGEGCEPLPRSLREVTGTTRVVGYAGGLGRANDIPTLLRAAQHLSDVPDLKIVIIGSGERRAAYEEHCRSHGLSNVLFMDAMPRRAARQLLAQMDVCVQPLLADSHFSHTLTSKTFDYHGLGKPMVFCGQGDTAKLIESAGSGIVAPPEDDRALADALRRLLEDEPLRRKMGDAGRRWFQRHISLDSFCAIMKEAMDRHAVA